MTINSWILFVVAAFVIGIIALYLMCEACSWRATIILTVLAIALIGGIWYGLHWFDNNTAAGRSAMIDQRSNISGLERVVTVYTADGNIIARYEGIIDLIANDGGYVKFDLDGKRYIYYNCFVESIAEIGD